MSALRVMKHTAEFSVAGVRLRSDPFRGQQAAACEVRVFVALTNY
jgi:hypothetical protein